MERRRIWETNITKPSIFNVDDSVRCNHVYDILVISIGGNKMTITFNDTSISSNGKLISYCSTVS